MPKYRALVAVPEIGPHEVCASDVREPLLAWKAAVEARGGIFHSNSLTRTCAQQQPFYVAYTAWKAAGKPKVYDKTKMSATAACRPGRSNHQGGRAIDLSTLAAFPHAPADKQVDLLWETGKPLGWTPIIAEPDEGESERWHFDFWGTWFTVKQHLGYDIACMCSALDVGQAGDWQSDARLVQALLLRAGIDIGEPDGILGTHSWTAIRKFTTETDLDVVIPLIRELPYATTWGKP